MLHALLAIFVPIIMSWESFIARRIYFDKDKRREVSPPAVRLAVAGVALGLAVMILSVACFYSYSSVCISVFCIGVD